MIKKQGSGQKCGFKYIIEGGCVIANPSFGSDRICPHTLLQIKLSGHSGQMGVGRTYSIVVDECCHAHWDLAVVLSIYMKPVDVTKSLLDGWSQITVFHCRAQQFPAE
jgi:hypothetical protein